MERNKKIIRAIVVDDTAFMRKALVEILSRDPDIEVVAVARHGQELLEIMEKTNPDIITLDVDMPVMDGLSTLKHIMVRNPRPVVMISGLAQKSSVTFEALRLGAVDFFPKPSGTISLNIHESGDELTKLIKQAAFINPHAIKRAGIPVKKYDVFSDQPLKGVITIMAPQGTTSHLIRLLANIRSDRSYAIMVFQNFSEDVLASYSKRMDEILPWKIENITTGTNLSAGSCFLMSALTALRLEIKDGHYELINAESNRGRRDIGRALARELKGRFLNIILGGVDSSGIDEIKEIREFGGSNIALASDKCVYSTLSEVAVSAGAAEPIDSEQSLWNRVNLFMESESF